MNKNKKIVPYAHYKNFNSNKVGGLTHQRMAQRYYLSKELRDNPSFITNKNTKGAEIGPLFPNSKQENLLDSKNTPRADSSRKTEKNKNVKAASNYYKVMKGAEIGPPAMQSGISFSTRATKADLLHESSSPPNDTNNLFAGEKSRTTVTQKTTPTLRTGKTVPTTSNNPKIARTKFLQKAEQLSRENGDTGNLSLQSSVSVRQGQIKTVNSGKDIIKTYYVARNIKGVKSAKLDSKTLQTLTQKKLQIYKNYQLQDLLADKASEQNKRIQYDKDKISDSSAEAIKFTRQTVNEIDDASKFVQHSAKQAVKTYKYQEKQKAKVIEKINTSKIKNTRLAKNLNKTYKKDQARKKLVYDHYKKSQIRKNLQKLSAIKFKMETTKTKVVSFVALKIGLPLLGLLVLYMMFGFISTALVNSASGYVAIGAEKNIIQNYQSHVADLDSAFKDIIRSEEAHGRQVHDEVIVNIASDSGEIQNNFKEFLVLAAVLFEQNLQYSAQEINKINEWYDLMNGYDLVVEPYQHEEGCIYVPPVDEDDDGYWYCPGHTRLYINVYCLTMEGIFDEIGFDEFQIDWARQLMLFDLDLLYPGMGFETSGGISGWNGMTNEEILNIIKDLPKAGAGRDKIVETALSLVGKVPYFWGGKSPAGWNNLWNTPQKVTSPGTSDYGKNIPYGLDCSGFVDWVFKTAGATNILGGGGTAYQWGQSYGIDKKVALPGDIVFLNPPNSGGINHIGIYIGKDGNGKDLFVHCAYGSGVTLDNGPGLKYWRRVKVNLD